ncbi:tol-pal system protein YbgF [Chromobacterium alkanivorans]|uniref:tol-pal system protein YbgF n=1 Tax=Chromobacterium TaxID=535 RepID=UPI00065444E7|nr:MULTISPECIES: tol-pal system protein YbgF [Chromobacterium]KMN77056.1 tol-pal system protein [Chromobacterium sp. LK11]MBN3006257.1 tol-pal system protein YbgF [Chromobacterium alkanivorans]MCS3805779.1 tol-pal system protein YbgF [Chromobacterium alkanivorans]MCS3819991.1 tol-pal system protein YbgF [Chromobacterium alkanivorans]MCS3874748.1 tol-pal system protein YbgF [Chromobacterium alkanivorans]
MKRLTLCSALLLVLTGCATTGDLEETRRQLDQVNRQASTRLNEVESKLSNEKLLEMVSQLEAMKAEVAKLRGDVEVLNYNLQTTQKRQNDLYNDLDGRLGHLENSGAKPMPATRGDAAAGSADGGATTSPDYDKALNLLRARDFAKAADALRGFIEQNPQAPQVAEATYWLGVSHTALRQYDAAIDIHRRFVEQFPDNHFAPEALRNIGNCQRDLGQMDQAKATYKRLIKLYPKTDSAQKARQQLAKM